MFIWTFLITKTWEITSCSYALKSWNTLYRKQTFLSQYSVPSLVDSCCSVGCLVAPNNQADKGLIMCVTHTPHSRLYKMWGNTSQTELVLKPRYRLPSHIILLEFICFFCSVSENKCVFVSATLRVYARIKQNSVCRCFKRRFLREVNYT